MLRWTRLRKCHNFRLITAELSSSTSNESSRSIIMPNPPPGELRLTVADAAEWSEWLDREAETSTGIWVLLARKGATKPTSLTWDQALDGALCHGWIDGQRHPVDETTYLQRYLPRRPMSMWSQRNKGHVARLESEGRMRPRGLQEVGKTISKLHFGSRSNLLIRIQVEKAKANGRWDSAYSQANLEPPAYLMAAIAAVPEAQAQWDILTKQNKFAICIRLAALKTEAGRQKRLQASVDQLARGETLHPQKQVRQPPATAPKKKTKKHPETKTSIAPDPDVDPSRRRSKRLNKAAQRSG